MVFSWIIVIAVVVGLYMAWNIGANDVANAMASAVGAKAITLKQAVFIAAILTFAGAYLVGSHVSDTVRKGIINPQLLADPKTYITGALAALISAGLWVTFATWKSMPVSTTHAIVGALIGFGLIAGGPQIVNWSKLLQVVLSWIISPVFSGLSAFFIFKSINRFIINSKKPLKAFEKVSPIFVFFTIAVIGSSLFLKANLGERLRFSVIDSLCLSISLSLVIALGYFYYIRWRKLTHRNQIDQMFRKLQIMTSCYVAFSHGANDVANAVGPVAGIFSVLKTNQLTMKVAIPTYLLALGGLGLTLGIVTWGYKVMETVGSKITKLTNMRGFTIDISAATSILVASKLGMPVSTTHAVVGAVVGVGFARGMDALDLRVIRNIIGSWLFTVPVAAITTIPIYYLISWLWR
ncbi:inorganic phosphate transporter [bacterium]|nr:inorganic phosphate transporter [bacterium]